MKQQELSSVDLTSLIIKVKTNNAGTSANNQFTIPTLGAFTYNYDVTTNDGHNLTGNTGNLTITFSGAGTYEITITGEFPMFYFNSTGDRLKILDILQFGFYSAGTNQLAAFSGCGYLNITASDVGDFSLVTSFHQTWRNCTDLTTFPLINTSSATSFFGAWDSCTSLANFPANAFDGCLATNFSNAFTNTNLTQTSIDNILTSLDTSGAINVTFNQSGGSAPSSTGEAAIDSLRLKGWTITVTGGY